MQEVVGQGSHERSLTEVDTSSAAQSDDKNTVCVCARACVRACLRAFVSAYILHANLYDDASLIYDMSFM